MDRQKLDGFRKQLLTLREQILNRNSRRVSEALVISTDDLTDETDHAAAIIQQGVALNVQERDRFLLKEIENALSKFEEGTYGLCEDTEEPIDEGRLQAEPYARFSVEAAELREHQAKRYAANRG